MVGYQRVYPTFALFSGGSDTYPFSTLAHWYALKDLHSTQLGFWTHHWRANCHGFGRCWTYSCRSTHFCRQKICTVCCEVNPPNLWRWHPRTFRRWTSHFFSVAILHFQFPPAFNCSFRPLQELVNVENTPMLLAEAVERVRPMCGGQNFSWERSHGSYGGKLHINFPIAAGTMLGPCDGRIPQIQRKV